MQRKAIIAAPRALARYVNASACLIAIAT